MTTRSRREVLKGAAAVAAVLTLPVPLRAAIPAAAAPAPGASPSAAAEAVAGGADPDLLNAYIRLPATGGAVFQCPYAEMGQGIYTGIAQILADELDIPFNAIRVEHAPPGDVYHLISFSPEMPRLRVTGGSLSTRSAYPALRKVAASARRMLIQAAAADWAVPEGECNAELGTVHHRASGRRANYAALTAKAAQLPIPDPILKLPSELRYIGKPMARLDSAAKINGTAQFGIDTRVPGMGYAAVKYSPILGGELESFDESLRGKPHILAVERIPGGIAVVADSFYNAKKALADLQVTWTTSPLAGFSSRQFAETVRARLDEPGETAESIGDAPAALATAATNLVAEYHVPFLAHGAMEPPNCTADVRPDAAEIWIGSQANERVVTMVHEVTKLSADKITVHTPFLGGGFGRRVAFADQVIPAVLLSQKVGKPVKLIFTREEDIQHDVYRPMTAVKLRAGFDAHKKPVAWHFTVVGDGPARNGNRFFKGKLDASTFGGLDKQPYAVANKRVDYVYEPIPVPIGYWRSVEHGANAFCKECFVDEMAAFAGEDEAQFRRALLGDAPRHLAVLDRLLALCKWRPQAYAAEDGTSRALGLALHEAFGSIIGEVAEVSIRDGAAVVHRVWAVVDCGVVINPAQVEAQLQSAIVFGLSAALSGEIVIDKGAVQQSNFTDYPILTLAAMPVVEVAIIDSVAPPGGIGEGGTPPIAPAVVNALAKLTGERIRSLPLSNHPLKEHAGASPPRVEEILDRGRTIDRDRLARE